MGSVLCSNTPPHALLISRQADRTVILSQLIRLHTINEYQSLFRASRLAPVDVLMT